MPEPLPDHVMQQVLGIVAEGDPVARVFAACEPKRRLVVCDIEGGEDALLHPAQIPQLTRADSLVEVHDFFIPGLCERLVQRFDVTHDVQRYASTARAGPVDELADLSDLDPLLAAWEWRAGPTPWLFLRSRAGM
ncbi:MAG: hypothetical protein GKR94_22490 [Gammaproteobacteria bacterium]|nr:hypothetical protein [Gammaproteobacteria bacterium]